MVVVKSACFSATSAKTELVNMLYLIGYMQQVPESFTSPGVKKVKSGSPFTSFFLSWPLAQSTYNTLQVFLSLVAAAGSPPERWRDALNSKTCGIASHTPDNYPLTKLLIGIINFMMTKRGAAALPILVYFHYGRRLSNCHVHMPLLPQSAASFGEIRQGRRGPHTWTSCQIARN